MNHPAPLQSILQKFDSLRILVVGDLMLDHYIWGDAHRISPEAPVPVLNVYKDTYVGGGAANVAINLASLGVQAALAGRTGKDEAARELDSILCAKRVQLNANWAKDGVPTIIKTRVIAQKQQLVRIDREAVPEQYRIDAEPDLERLRQSVADADAVILSDYAKGVVTQSLIDFLVRQCSERGVLLALDPKPRRQFDLRNAGLMTPNRAEALQLAQIEIGLHEEFPAQAVCERIWQKYSPQRLVVTMGADGMLLCEQGKILGRIPTRAREVFDVSGAGDTVISTLTAALAAGAGFAEAAHIANAAAGVVVGKLGTATTSREELSSELQRQSDIGLLP